MWLGVKICKEVFLSDTIHLIMSIREAEQYLPARQGLADVYGQANLWHLSVGRTVEEIVGLPEDRVAKLGRDYLAAGVGYLANRGHDEYMQQVGTDAWNAIDTPLPVVFAVDIRSAAIRFGVPPEYVVYFPEDAPVFTVGRMPTATAEASGMIFIPPGFIIVAKEEPVLALASTAYISAQLRDYSKGRDRIDPHFLSDRADATEAHFLTHALVEYPDLPLTDFHHHILAQFPKGIASLPPEALYL